ncbi:MAG: YitT family protein [Clostridia bacterium]|nr:YitT family protein [Clostridia bacterium]
MRVQWKKALKLPPLRQCACLLLGTAILSFGLYYIHRQSGVTEGGVLGLVLLLNHHFHWPAHVMTPILDGLCYLLGWRFLGWEFMKRSVIATLGMTGFYKLWSLLPPLIPGLSAMPLAAALIGCVFVGVGVGLVVRMGGSAGGDDALALVISKLTKLRLARSYLFTDLTVLALSLTYIPVERIAYSLVTVTLSSFIIDKMQKKEKSKSPA